MGIAMNRFVKKQKSTFCFVYIFLEEKLFGSFSLYP